MSIITKDGFYFFDSFNGRLSMILDKRTDKIIEYVNLHYVKSLVIQPKLHDVLPKGDHPDYFLSDITETGFLQQMPNLSEIAFIDVKDCNLDGLYCLKNLRSLTIANDVNNPSKNLRVDFSKFKNLEKINVDWFDKGFDISRNDKVVSVSINKYRPQSRDLSELPLPKSVRNIELIQSNIQSLDGATDNSIEKMELYYFPYLETLNGIRAFSGHLHRLMIENARHLSDYDEIKYCKALESLVFADCGNIDSLNWVKALEKLSHFVLDKTVVDDGDMKSLLHIEKVAFTNKKHYNCKCKFHKGGDWKYIIVPTIPEF